MAGLTSSPELCLELLTHPSMNSPIVVFMLHSFHFSQKRKIRFEALHMRSAGAELVTIGKEFGISKGRAQQYVLHGIFLLKGLVEFDTKYRTTSDLIGPIDVSSRFIANGFESWLDRRGINTWEQLASLSIENVAAFSPHKRDALRDFLVGLSSAILQSSLTIGPVLQQVNALFASDSSLYIGN